MCQALGKAPSMKYQNEGGPGPSDVAGLIRGVMPARIAEEAIWRFADALIWNWLVAGTDGHAKNYSLLLADNDVRLAPLYDIASGLPYGTNERKLRLAMKIGGEYDVFPARNNWPAAAKQLRVDADRLQDRVIELAQMAPEAFADAAGADPVKALDRPLPATLVSLVADRSTRCLTLLRA
jgi:serine/threonine-protein kinase HipA